MDIVRHLWNRYSLGGVFQKGLSSFVLVIVMSSILSLVASCKSDQNQNQNQKKIYTLQDNKIVSPPKITLSSQSNAQLHSDYAKQLNNVLLAELYSQFGKAELSAKYYQKLLTNSYDPEIARRATTLAAMSGQPKYALEAVRVWVNLLPDSLEARQYYSLLLLRNNKFNESVEQLHLINQLVEKEDAENGVKKAYSKGLKFIGSMLSIESHHEKSFIAFQYYMKEYGSEKYKSQQNLIISSLAMNAKKYDVVLSALKNIEEDESIQSSKITLMKVKALQALNRISEAVDTLQSFVDKQQTSDSIRLQLVRLLILDRQKNAASPYLKELVKKHPDNNDLLKSLIALEIEQSHLQSARQNIKKLSKSKEYQSDVSYFRGEIYEAEGDLKSALKNYQQVVDGSLQKRARKKIIKLGKGLITRKVNYKEAQ
ncbi:MAG TPA: hypothetical protein EYH38_04265 [Leucothrix sp.]|nr:hypothetical protein [Leucothrix sp.]